MKKFSILPIVILLLTSCSNDDDAVAHRELMGEWELVRTIAQFEGSERTGDEMEWQESYLLREDGTFTKKRLRDNETTFAEGTYVITEESQFINQQAIAYISLTYENENNIIATCYSDILQEDLYFPTTTLMKGTFHYCDGLEMEYTKKTK